MLDINIKQFNIEEILPKIYNKLEPESKYYEIVFKSKDNYSYKNSI